jgi:hypothetical protein
MSAQHLLIFLPLVRGWYGCLMSLQSERLSLNDESDGWNEFRLFKMTYSELFGGQTIFRDDRA